MPRLLASLCAFIWALSIGGHIQAAPSASGDGPYYVIVFLVKSGNADASDKGSSWARLFKQNMQLLLAQISSGGPGAKGYIKVLVQDPDEVANGFDPDGLKMRFGAKLSLQAVNAIPYSVGKTVAVDSIIYIGDWKGSLPLPYLAFSQTILQDQYAMDRDALAVVTLYAYSMALASALPAGSNQFPVCDVLQRANLYNNSLDTTARTKLEQFGLFKAITDELEHRECGGKKK